MQTRSCTPQCAVCFESLLPNVQAVVRSTTCSHSLHWRCLHMVMAEKVGRADTSPLQCPMCRSVFLPSVRDKPTLRTLYTSGAICKHAIVTLMRADKALAMIDSAGV